MNFGMKYIYALLLAIDNFCWLTTLKLKVNDEVGAIYGYNEYYINFIVICFHLIKIFY